MEVENALASMGEKNAPPLILVGGIYCPTVIRASVPIIGAMGGNVGNGALLLASGEKK